MILKQSPSLLSDSIEIRNLTYNDEDALAKLNEIIAPRSELQQAYPDRMATAALSGHRMKFSYCGEGKAITYLKDQYAIGTLEIKVVQLRAKYYI